MTWEIFLGIGSLLSFLVVVTGPLMKLNTNITKLGHAVDTLQSSITRLEQENDKSHKRIWEHSEVQDAKIAEHETRLNNFEHTLIMAEKMNPELQGLHAVVSLHSQLKEQ